jgi:hypothetical protein
MAEIRAQFHSDGRVVVDHQADAGPLRYGQDGPSHAANLFERRFLGAQLNQIRPAIAKLLRDRFRRPPAQVGSINEGVKPAFMQWSHSFDITVNLPPAGTGGNGNQELVRNRKSWEEGPLDFSLALSNNLPHANTALRAARP